MHFLLDSDKQGFHEFLVVNLNYINLSIDLLSQNQVKFGVFSHHVETSFDQRNRLITRFRDYFISINQKLLSDATFV